MSLLDTLKSAAGQILGNKMGDSSQMMSVVSQLLEGSGGAAGLMEKFKASGLDSHVQSWLGSGANMALSAETLTKVLGSDKLASMAQSFGISSDVLTKGLSAALPQVIDKMSPGGQLTDMSPDKLLEMGKGLFSKLT
jgi:uncharacterized protein YidB (DUF937 family)